MMQRRFNSPPSPSTPREAPWTDAQSALEALNSLDVNIITLKNALDALNGLLQGISIGGGGGNGGNGGISIPASPTQLRSNVEDVGLATGGTETTLNDTTKYWSTGTWAGGIVFLAINNQLYIAPITANTDQQLTFATLPVGVKPIAGTPYAIKMIGVTAAQLVALVTPFLTKTAARILNLTTLAPLATSALIDCTPISLVFGESSLALTVSCTFNIAALQGLRVHVRTSYDGTLWDTQDWDTWNPAFVAGGTIRATKVYDVSPAYVRVLIENLDGAQPVTAIATWATIRG
jgi:hypothetical protein